MIVSDKFKNKSYYVFGLGRTGKSAVKSLVTSGATVTAWDNSEANLAAIDECEKIPPSKVNWSEIDSLVLSPGVPIIGDNKNEVVTLAEANNVEIISDFDLLYIAQPNATYVGITGTNGKSTTTALVGHILKNSGKNAQVGGNIGIPVMDLNPLESDGIYVLEASSYQLDITKYLKFNIGAIINITPDHLDRHLSFENYLNAKKRIFDGNQVSISSIDYKHLENLKDNLTTFSKKSKQAKFSLIDGILMDGDKLHEFKNMKYIPGEHNYENILTAYIICKNLGLSDNEIVKQIHTFKGLPHRIELVKEENSLKYINDSKATNADAAEKALKSFENIYWIVGGRAKTDGIDALVPLFSRVKKAYLIGESQERFEQVFKQTNCAYQKVGTIENALNQLAQEDIKQGVVLLSPACASFDQFKDFEERGDVFKSLVRKTSNN